MFFIVGYMYGGKNNKTLKYFLDDIHLPNNDICEHQSVNALLQQILDRKLIYCQMKGYQRKFIEGLSVIATMTHNFYDANENKPADKLTRLLV